VHSAGAVRRILEQSGQVLAVFQGHNHLNDLREIGGIRYCTLAAMVEGSGEENNAYCVARVYEDGSIAVEGFRTQASHDWGSSGSRQ
jgi:alkaline phosphatase